MDREVKQRNQPLRHLNMNFHFVINGKVRWYLLHYWQHCEHHHWNEDLFGLWHRGQGMPTCWVPSSSSSTRTGSGWEGVNVIATRYDLQCTLAPELSTNSETTSCGWRCTTGPKGRGPFMFLLHAQLGRQSTKLMIGNFRVCLQAGVTNIFSRVNFLCLLLFGIHSTLVLPM